MTWNARINLGYLGGLPAAGLTDDNRSSVILHQVKDGIPVLEHRQPLPLPLQARVSEPIRSNNTQNIRVSMGSIIIRLSGEAKNQPKVRGRDGRREITRRMRREEARRRRGRRPLHRQPGSLWVAPSPVARTEPYVHRMRERCGAADELLNF
ncbi:hypothetical protein BHM03_00007823 [Ensete ventricosum]|nr:hypothetical protein BHM03_00007823 [Ensete ventricosum]